MALLAMFGRECTRYPAHQVVADLADFRPDWSTVPDFTRELMARAEEHDARIEKQLSDTVEHWSLERIGIVERALLKLACTEINYFADIPPRVTINEYVELAKEFSNEQGPAFINGILDKIVQLSGKPDIKLHRAGS